MLLASRGADDVLMPFTACPPPASHHLRSLHGHCSTQRSASHHPISVALRNELPSTTLLISVSGKASGSCWRTKKYGCTQNSVTQAEKLFQAGSRSQPIAQMAASSHLCLFPFSLRHDCSVEAAGRKLSCAFVAFPCLLDSFP